MSLVRSTSTINIKPTSISATNLVPGSVSTINYASYIDTADDNTYGGFKYGAQMYGETTRYSVGQKMPKISTVEI